MMRRTKKVLSGLKLEEKMLERGLTTARLGRAAHTSRQRIHGMIARGVQSVDIDMMDKLCRALECDQRDLTVDVLI